jgi:hypothetical protein
MSDRKTAGLRALAPLRTRDYRLLFAAVGIEVFGTGMWTIVMVLEVLALNDSPLALSAAQTGAGEQQDDQTVAGRSAYSEHRHDLVIGCSIDRRRRLTQTVSGSKAVSQVPALPLRGQRQIAGVG